MFKIVKCKICNNELGNYPEAIVLCKHHNGPVHLGCCIDLCSWDKKPCKHSQGTYEKL